MLGSALLWHVIYSFFWYGHDESDYSMHSNSFDANYQVHTHLFPVLLDWKEIVSSFISSDDLR